MEGVSRRGSRGLSSKATLVRAEYTGCVGMSVCRRMACPRAYFGLLKVGDGGCGDVDRQAFDLEAESVRLVNRLWEAAGDALAA